MTALSKILEIFSRPSWLIPVLFVTHTKETQSFAVSLEFCFWLSSEREGLLREWCGKSGCKLGWFVCHFWLAAVGMLTNQGIIWTELAVVRINYIKISLKRQEIKEILVCRGACTKCLLICKHLFYQWRVKTIQKYSVWMVYWLFVASELTSFTKMLLQGSRRAQESRRSFSVKLVSSVVYKPVVDPGFGWGPRNFFWDIADEAKLSEWSEPYNIGWGPEPTLGPWKLLHF